MDEYIEKNKAIKELYEVYDYEFPTASGGFDEYARMIVPNTIKNMPAADVAPVRHGRWIKESDGGTRCSVCNKRVRDVTGGWDEPVDLSDMPYCPKCGARMNEEADHAQE